MSKDYSELNLPDTFVTSFETSSRVSSARHTLVIEYYEDEFHVEVETEFDMTDLFGEFSYWPEELIASASSPTLRELILTLSPKDKSMYAECIDQIEEWFDEAVYDRALEHEFREPLFADYVLEEDSVSKDETALKRERRRYADAYGDYSLGSVRMYKERKHSLRADMMQELSVSMTIKFYSRGWKMTLVAKEANSKKTYKRAIRAPIFYELLPQIEEKCGWYYWDMEIEQRLGAMFNERLVETRCAWKKYKPSLKAYLLQEEECGMSRKKLSTLRKEYQDAYSEYKVTGLTTPNSHSDVGAINLEFSQRGWVGSLYGPSDTDEIANARSSSSSSLLEEALRLALDDDYYWDKENMRRLARKMIADDPMWKPLVAAYLVESETP